ncbi:SDR family NAD(P)-dependent oxidoreductase [Pseudonocardia sp. RS010]|uniref:SDR family NAD(P)-dependent oxidoreductase n=1 Tax=Pseudonocardia sp. RS010 TaxID=3385979 RepID=UPI00399F7028
MTGPLTDRVAIVTGAGSGIGAATAARFAKAGAVVVCADIDPTAAKEVATRLGSAGAAAEAATVDVSLGADVEAMVQAVRARHGRIDVLVNNAGVGSSGAAVDVDEDEWNRVLAVNLTAVWRCSRAVLPVMAGAGSGSIVNLASITALHGYPRMAAYSAAKGGVIALTRQMAADAATHGVRVNAVVPGTVHTPLTQTLWDDGGGFGGTASSVEEQVAAAGAGYPLGRLGTPDEPAALIAFLAGADSRWITGQVYVVDGGRTAVG